MSTVAAQLEAIHSMLAAGHRSVRVQGHSLVLWGVVAGLLCIFTEHIITPARFPVPWQRAVALLVFLATVLAAVAIADISYTRHRIRTRDESLPFVQAQVTKVLWLLVGMGVLFTFATSFFGGGYMVFVIWLVLFGLGIYVHGLFSEQILEWTGVMMILLGIGALALRAPYVATQWLAASAFGLGLPLLSTMLDRGASKSVGTRAAQSVLWLAVVLVPAALAYEWVQSQQAPNLPAVSLDSLARQPGSPATAVVTLPAGIRVPVKVHIGGDIVDDQGDMTLQLTLRRPIDVVLVDGKPNGQFRVADGPWKLRRDSVWIQHVQLKGMLEPAAGPAAAVSLSLTVDH